MQPNQPSNNVPSIKQPGNWSPFDNYTNDIPPPKQSFFSKYKKLIIVSAVSIVLLITLAVLASTSDTSNKYTEGPSTDVTMASLENSTLSMSYPEGMMIVNNAVDEAGDYGLYIVTNQDSLTGVSVSVMSADPLYGDATTGLSSNQTSGSEPTNITESDVVMAGQQTTKAVGDITSEDGKTYKAVYAGVMVGSKFVMVTAEYLPDNSNMADSFDAMIGSIKLK